MGRVCPHGDAHFATLAIAIVVERETPCCTKITSHTELLQPVTATTTDAPPRETVYLCTCNMPYTLLDASSSSSRLDTVDPRALIISNVSTSRYLMYNYKGIRLLLIICEWHISWPDNEEETQNCFDRDDNEVDKHKKTFRIRLCHVPDSPYSRELIYLARASNWQRKKVNQGR